MLMALLSNDAQDVWHVCEDMNHQLRMFSSHWGWGQEGLWHGKQGLPKGRNTLCYKGGLPRAEHTE